MVNCVFRGKTYKNYGFSKIKTTVQVKEGPKKTLHLARPDLFPFKNLHERDNGV